MVGEALAMTLTGALAMTESSRRGSRREGTRFHARAARGGCGLLGGIVVHVGGAAGFNPLDYAVRWRAGGVGWIEFRVKSKKAWFVTVNVNTPEDMFTEQWDLAIHVVHTNDEV